MKRQSTITAFLVVLSLLLSACGTQQPAAPSAATNAPAGPKDQVDLQLKWVAQAQFAGYYAAKAKGYWDQLNLDVTIKPGGPDIIPEQVVAAGGAEFGIDWLPSLLSSREQGSPLVNIAQIFQRSGMLEISWKDNNITKPEDLEGKKVGVWVGGNEFELLAALNKAGLNKDTDLEIVQQPFDMNLLLNRQVDAAAAMTYNELAQVLETKNPDTGELYQLSDLNIIDFNQVGTAMLQDGIFATEDFLKDAKNQDITMRFLKGAFQGWIYCRDHYEECTDIVVSQGTALGRGHQLWQMNEVNKLIWPSPNGIGIMDPALFQQTAQIAQNFGVINNAPSEGAYVTTYAEQALAGLTDMDTKGANFQAATVTVTEGGK